MENKFALCLYGNVGSAKTWKDGVKDSQENSFSEIFPFWQKHLLSHNQLDIFIHSWSVSQKENIVSLLKPKASVIETQRKFSSLVPLYRRFLGSGLFNPFLWNLNNNPLLFLYNIWWSYPKNKQYFWNTRIKAARSRWYSTSRSLELAQIYSEKNKINYELIISARIDLILKKRIDLKALNKEKFYAAFFNQTPSALNNNTTDRSNKTFEQEKFSDLIFFGKPLYINHLCDINENFNAYPINPHESSYEAITKKFGKEVVDFYLYPWIDFETGKTYFHDWKMGDS